ncbi:MAG: outer membrane beta-barrel protein [Candidatus Omnitrophica bacterium]|nr:outer membrane beta-barrel protein [Candidatus Omnitrophota bacterium]
MTFVKEDKKSDNVTNLLIGLGAKQEGKTHTLALEGNLTRHLFADNPSFNNNSQDLNIDFQKELSRYDRFSATNKFVHSEEPRSFEDDFGRTTGRYSYYRNTFNAEYTRDLSKHVSIQGHYGNENYSTSREDIRDSLLNRAGFDVNYIESSATAFLLGYDFTTRHIDESGTAAVHTLATGFRHSLTTQLYIDTRAGVSFVEAFDGSSASKPSAAVALTDDFNETDSASLSYSKTSTPSSFTADIFDSWRVALSLGRQLLERLKMTASVFFGEGDFAAQGITDRQTGASTRLSYEVTRNAQTFLAYTYSEVNSNIDTRGYDRNWVEVGVRVVF